MANQPNPTGWDIPKRYLRLRLRSLNKKIGPTDYTLGEDLHIKFNTVASVSGALTEANIVIGGLQVDSMFNIATSATPWIDQWYQYEVIIEAGYYQNYTTIFRGTILDAAPNLQSADYTITIKAMSGFNAATTAYSYNQAGRVPVSKIAAIIAKDNHLAFYDGLQDDSITVNDFTIQNQSLPNNFIDQQPVRLDVTFSHVLIISGISESMISIRLRQRLLVTQQRDHFLQLLRIAASLDRKLVISFELPRKLRLKHSAPPSDLQRYQTDHTYPLPFLPPPSPHR